VLSFISTEIQNFHKDELAIQIFNIAENFSSRFAHFSESFKLLNLATI
jgi:hypothetical protein